MQVRTLRSQDSKDLLASPLPASNIVPVPGSTARKPGLWFHLQCRPSCRAQWSFLLLYYCAVLPSFLLTYVVVLTLVKTWLWTQPLSSAFSRIRSMDVGPWKLGHMTGALLDLGVPESSLMAESKELKEPLDESEREEWKSWLKTQHSENEDRGIWSHLFMANRWWNNGNSERLFFGASKSQQMVTAAMKLKDACSLKEKLWPTWTAY